jgi:hypothetical protein
MATSHIRLVPEALPEPCPGRKSGTPVSETPSASAYTLGKQMPTMR